MGAYRSKPEKEKVYESGGNDSIRFASCSMQGWRIHQEDADNCIIDFMPNMSFFAVYDGHGGPEVAQYLSLHFPDYLKNLQFLNNFDSDNLPTNEEIQNILGQAFLQFDETLTSQPVFEKLTALTVDSSKQKDSPKTEQEEQHELLEEAVALSKESRISLEKIIKRYTKYQELLLKNASSKEENEGEEDEEEESEEVVELTSERSCRRITKRSVMLFNSPQIPKRIKLSDEGLTEEEHNVGTSKVSEETLGEDKKEKNGEKLLVDKDTIKNNKMDEISPSNGKIKNKEVEEKEQNFKNKKDLKKEEVIPLIAAKEEELVLPALEEFEVSSTSTSITCKTTVTNTNITAGDVVKTSLPKKETAALSIKDEKEIAKIEEIPSSSTSNLNKNKQQGIAQLLRNLDEMNEEEEEEEDSDYKVEEDEGEIADSTSNEVEDEEAEDECIEGEEEEEEDSSIEEEDLNSLMMRTDATRPGFDSGSTACMAFLLKNHIIVANVGDTRAVLCRSKKAIDLSVDHKPEDKLEKDRINAAGGNVSSDGRVNGGLNLSRAFGDHFYKQERNLPLHSQQITAFPDITVTTRDFENDDFLVVACDGIWNSLTSQQVCDFVLERINCIGLKEITAEICDYCCANDTDGDGTGCDNETIILIDLKKERPLSPQVSSSTLLITEQENQPNSKLNILNEQKMEENESQNNNEHGEKVKKEEEGNK